MKNNKPQFLRIIIPALLLCGVSFGLYYVLSQVKEKGATVADLTLKTTNEINRRNKISALNLEIKAIAPDRALLETHFAESSNVVPFLDTLQDLGEKAGAPAEISSVSLGEDGKKLKVTMSAQGNFYGVYKLLSLIEISPYELELEGVRFERKSLSDAEVKTVTGPLWRANFTINLLSFNVK